MKRVIRKTSNKFYIVDTPARKVITNGQEYTEAKKLRRESGSTGFPAIQYVAEHMNITESEAGHLCSLRLDKCTSFDSVEIWTEDTDAPEGDQIEITTEEVVNQ